ncbi:uncharacterized protein At4g00950-like [Prosopis cineraria]|uniref:uncharacterized protein At4g00950-like n=1 Tax=Prosopis cineraria TaxID=364024 RepID=UPI00240FCBE5|nr:uncharacterized protein At4g00950-like [Prosopis cineraria]
MGMDSKAEAAEQSSTISVPVLPVILSSSSSVSTPPSPDPSGTLTPPLHSAAAAVPFRWEQEPGKPKHTTAIVPFSISSLTITDSSPKSLELPPRLLAVENPPHGLGSSSRFRSPSLRMGSDCYGSFRAEGSWAVIRSGRQIGFGAGEKRRWFGSWRMKKREVNGGSHVFPSCGADHRKTSDVVAIGGTRKNRVKMKGTGLWASIWEGLRQMGVWRSQSKTLKKDEYASSL